MSIQVAGEAEVLREVNQVLMEQLSPAKVARYWAGWHRGQGDYLRWRDELFVGETVATLYEKIQTYQGAENRSPSS